MKKVKSGDSLVIPAATFNTFIDAARDFRGRCLRQGRQGRSATRHSGLIPVKNASGSDGGRFNILGIDAPIFTPAEAEETFKNDVAFTGVTPSVADHTGKFVVLMEPIQAGEIGLACAYGVCPVKVDVQDVADGFAEIADADATKLKSGPAGSATKLADDETMAAITKGGFSVSSGTVSLEFDLTVAGDWRPGNAGLVDAAGRGIYLDCLIGDTYVQIGARNTTDNALTGTGGSVTDAPADASVGITIRYEINLDTGQVKGYIDGHLKHTVTLDLSSVGPITNVVLQAKKHWYLDNVVVNGE